MRAPGGKRSKTDHRQLLRFVAPGVVVAVLAVLVFSQVFYALVPYRRRAYVPILLMTATGFALGQLWDFLGLPSLRLGQANMLPAIPFALMLQPLARFVPRAKREPKEPKASKDTKPHEPGT
jgi:hypothetical protein